MIQVGPTICTFDQDRMFRSRLVLLLCRKIKDDEIPFQTVSVVKNSYGFPTRFEPSLCSKTLFAALWEMGEAVDDADYRIIYMERENLP